MADGGTNLGGKGFSLWTGIGGVLCGAIVMGGIWGITSMGHGTAQAAGSSSAAVATVNGQTISHATLQNTLLSQYGSQTLTGMIENRLVQDAAKADKITASQSDVQNAEAGIEAEYNISGSAELASFLQQQGMTNAQFQTMLKNDVLEEKLATRGIKVTNKEIAAYYKANKSQFIPSGSKTAAPLSEVKSQIVADIEQSKAVPASTLLADLAKKYHLTVPAKEFQAVKTAIEDPAPTTSTGG